ncbi:hypothetical protein NDU88_006152 [Pleurodeles waltl]|uniref:Uncharacterized protein n=1 Tax=Pleurodeles waltl TaxID=8319 RepID=A0AAV7TXL3_PLEWA|nr:hypothetical protein NDU88_006152 [Pleurodeles waltl]
MVRNKGQLPQQNNKMDKYPVPKRAGGPATLEEAGEGQAAEVALLSEPSLGSIMAAIQDLKGMLEPKLDAVTGCDSPVGRPQESSGKSRICGDGYCLPTVYIQETRRPVYAPPQLQGPTLADLGELLLGLPMGLLIEGGDMNLVVDPGLDRVSHARAPDTSVLMLSFLDSFGPEDLRREHNPEKQQFTYSCVPHGGLSRLDYLLTAQTHIGRVREVCTTRGASRITPLRE